MAGLPSGSRDPGRGKLNRPIDRETRRPNHSRSALFLLKRGFCFLDLFPESNASAFDAEKGPEEDR